MVSARKRVRRGRSSSDRFTGDSPEGPVHGVDGDDNGEDHEEEEEDVDDQERGVDSDMAAASGENAGVDNPRNRQSDENVEEIAPDGRRQRHVSLCLRAWGAAQTPQIHKWSGGVDR